MNSLKIAIVGLEADASDLATRLKLPISEVDDVYYDYLLVKCKDHLELRAKVNRFKPFVLDYLQGAIAFRRERGGSELLIKAVGLNKNRHLKILDVTAGLGRDAFIMACYGGKVTLLERNPIVFCLLEDAIERLVQVESLPLQPLNVDALSYLQSLIDKPDVIYCDPMFPEKTKSAKVKKEMAFLQALIGFETDSDALLSIALQRALKRVVVKRPILAPPLANKQPDFVIKSKKFRFDVYQVGL